MEKETFYITTAIPYVNAKPHIGHALEFIQADVVARHHRRKKETLLLSGSDENALKNVQAAEKAGRSIQQFIDENARLFSDLAEKLSVQFDVFQKGSEQKHHESSKKLWELCAKQGDIYKKQYEGLYCVGCEAFYTPDELGPEGECLEHPGRALETITEENYFFRLSRYQEKIISLLEKEAVRIVPAEKKNEVMAFLKNPLQDISISRSNARAKDWGVPVPGDESQRMYVWFDALNIYQSGIGFGYDQATYEKWWPADVHVIGKGIIRFHAVYWPAFLLSAGLLLPKTIFVHGYITVDGQKMSKTLGNVIDPFELIEKYGADPVRYFFLREIPSTQDGDFSIEKFEGRYNADLAGGLGNLSSRVLAMAKKQGIAKGEADAQFEGRFRDVREKTEQALEEFDFSGALETVWSLIHGADKYIEQEKPWQASDNQERAIQNLLAVLSTLQELIWPFLPTTSEELGRQLETQESAPLFPRLS